jgi:hypothetical protein
VRELSPGIWHWTAFRESIGMDVSSYWIEPAGVVIDPMVPPDAGLDWWEGREVEPRQIVLTIGLHWRQSDQFVQRFGCPVRCPRPAIERFEGTDRRAEPFDFGDEVAPGVTALEVDAIAPDEAALDITHGDGAVAVGDGLVRMDGDGSLSFVPDFLMGDEPQAVKAGLRQAYARLLEHDFELLLLAHGDPVVGGASDVLRDFLRGAP